MSSSSHSLSYYGHRAPPPAPSPLSREDEDRAFLRYHKRKNAKDRELLLRKYLCWAFSIAAKFAGPRLDIDEAVSVANEGLVEALNGFNPTLGFRFTTYASWSVRRKLIEALVNTYPVLVSDHLRKKWRELEKAPENLAATLLETVSDQPRSLEEFFARLGATSPVGDLNWSERPEDAPFVPAPAADPVEESNLSSQTVAVRAAVASLLPLEQEVIKARHYKEPAESYITIAKRLKVSKSSARSAYDMAVIKLKRQFTKDKTT